MPASEDWGESGHISQRSASTQIVQERANKHTDTEDRTKGGKTAAKRREREKLQGREREKQERADKQTEPPAGPKREI